MPSPYQVVNMGAKFPVLEGKSRMSHPLPCSVMCKTPMFASQHSFSYLHWSLLLPVRLPSFIGMKCWGRERREKGKKEEYQNISRESPKQGQPSHQSTMAPAN